MNTEKQKRYESFREARKKLNALPKDIPIYYYGGHGIDVCHYDTHEPMTAVVPDDCIYITITECGRVAYYNGNIENFFREQTEESRNVLRYPYLVENLLKLSKMSGISIDNIHIHLPGSTYVVANFIPLSFFNTPKAFGMSISGLCEKRDLEKLPPDSNPRVMFQKNKFNFKETIKESISKEKVLELLQSIENLNNILAEGLTNGTRPKEYLEYLFPIKNNLTGADIDYFLESLLYRIKKDVILRYFSASKYPTEEQVKVLTDKYFKNIDYLSLTQIDRLNSMILSDIFKVSYADILSISSKLEITNTTMMSKFPGIHFNVVCRSVSESCIPKATLRRAHSSGVETERIGEYLEQHPESIYTYNLSKLQSKILSREPRSIEEFTAFLEKHKEKLSELSLDEKNELMKLIFFRGTQNIGNPDEKQNLFQKLYDTLFPFKEKYSPEELIQAFTENIPHNYKSLLFNYKNSKPFYNHRVSEYIKRLDKEEIEKMSPTEKEKVRTNTRLNRMKYSLSTPAYYEELLSFFKEAPLMRPSAPIYSKYVNKSRKQSKTKTKARDVVFGPIFIEIKKRLFDIINRVYPKASTPAESISIKQGAIYNSLLSIKDKLKGLAFVEKDGLIQILESENIVNPEGTKNIPMSKKIKQLIWPEKYSGGGRKRVTRKNRNLKIN